MGPLVAREFDSTHWSLVLAAGDRGRPEAQAALTELCQRYWLPLCAYVRRRVPDADQAQDLTQDFFARLLEKDLLAAADPARGRFRSFLLTSLQHFLAHAHESRHAQKRGGGQRILSLTPQFDESGGPGDPGHGWTPEKLFHRQWALALLQLVLGQLREEWEAVSRPGTFADFQPFLTGDGAGPRYAEISARLKIAPAAARKIVSRLRQRYRELLHSEVARTVADPADVDDELNHLFEALAAP